MNKVLVLATHPDDETLGCGGTLLKHRTGKDEIYWLIATYIEEGSGFTKKNVLQRETEIEKVAKMYGFRDVFKLNFPSKGLDKIPRSEIIDQITIIFNRVRPNIIYLPFKGDIHSDHRIMFETSYSCTKSFRYPSIKKILMMETISETEFAASVNENAFVPNYFVDITGFLKPKLDIMKVYKKELKIHPFPRNIENIKALSIFRGATSGFKYAESFMILRETW